MTKVLIQFAHPILSKSVIQKMLLKYCHGVEGVTVNDQHLDQILAQGTQFSWKDEYVTVSMVCIINSVVAGGILAGFGYPKFLEGAIIGVNALSTVFQGDLGFMLKATVMAAIGLNVWRKF